MAITFLQKRKIQQSLILALIAVFVITAFVLWLGFRKKTTQAPEEDAFKPRREVNIDFQALDASEIEKLEEIKKIESFEGDLGRENPFLSY